MSDSGSENEQDYDPIDKICGYFIARYLHFFPGRISVINSAHSRSSIFPKKLMDSDFEELKPILAVLLRGNEGSLSFRNIRLSFIGK
mmetsp:Transcript_28936/g.48589  ORF Transcript_28936/g.48589 Transcript_28936/m.48589 type:complete len:87 (+) Transcript_28936:383-643(+)